MFFLLPLAISVSLYIVIAMTFLTESTISSLFFKTLATVDLKEKDNEFATYVCFILIALITISLVE